MDRTNLLTNMQPIQEQDHSGPTLDNLPPVTPDEVENCYLVFPANHVHYILFQPLSSNLVQMFFSEIISTLTNLSFTEGRFPTAFKQAIVTPLLKKPDLNKSDPANYRPISNLNNISKLFERLFLARFQPHVTSSPNFNPLQSAYRRFHSTAVLRLLNTVDQVYTAADASKPTLLVSLDPQRCLRYHRPPHPTV